MVYIEINGLRIEQETLLAIGETIVAHAFVAALFLTVHLPWLRPHTNWTTVRWIRPWKIYLTVYAVMALIAEALWVQLGSLGRLGSETNEFVCAWSQQHLMVWGMVQGGALLAVLSTWSYSRRGPVAQTLRGVCGTHAMVMMAMAMAGMYETGACGAMVFPALASVVGMMATCCFLPWHTGAWDMHPPLAEAVIRDSEEERGGFTLIGWWCLSRKRAKEARRQRATPYETAVQRKQRKRAEKAGGEGRSSSDDDDEEEGENSDSPFLAEMEDGETQMLDLITPENGSNGQAPHAPMVDDPHHWPRKDATLLVE